jgi:hypothetical protein
MGFERTERFWIFNARFIAHDILSKVGSMSALQKRTAAARQKVRAKG